MPDDSSATVPDRRGIPLEPLIRSLPAVRCVYVALIFVAGLSAVLFLYQLNYEIEPGVRFVSVPGNWVHVYMHLVRGLIAAGLAWALHRYLREMRLVRNGNGGGEESIAVALARWWNLLATSLLVALGFGVVSAVVTSRSTGDVSDFETYQPIENPEVRAMFSLAETQPRETLLEAFVEDTGEQIWLHPEPIIWNEHIGEASASITEAGYPVIRLTFTPEGESRMREATRENIGGRLAIEINEVVVSAPVIEWEIGRSAIVDMGEDVEETKRIARALSGRE